MKALLHITSQGERWDLIAWRYYRDVSRTADLVAANPHAPYAPQLASGIRLVIPLIERATLKETLPPWRR